MANPIYKMFGGNKANNPMNFIQQFPKFMQQMRGQNPQQILNNLVASGKVSQDQLNYAQQQAQEMGSAFEQFKGMFS